MNFVITKTARAWYVFAYDKGVPVPEFTMGPFKTEKDAQQHLYEHTGQVRTDA